MDIVWSVQRFDQSIWSASGFIFGGRNCPTLEYTDRKKKTGAPFGGHTRETRFVSFSPDGRCVVSGSLDKTMRLWSTETKTLIGDPF